MKECRYHENCVDRKGVGFDSVSCGRRTRYHGEYSLDSEQMIM